MPVCLTSTPRAVHPGVILAAEQFAVRTQHAALLQLLPSSPSLPSKEALGRRLRVVASAHTDLGSLLYNQPAVFEQPGGVLVVHVHVYLHFRCRAWGFGCMEWGLSWGVRF